LEEEKISQKFYLGYFFPCLIPAQIFEKSSLRV
jgi:hypothetical protein